MPSVGERLRDQREARHTTIEELSAATGIHLGYLEAMERDDVQSLPGRAFGKLYIRAYAESLGFDPQSLIDEYEREQDLKRQASTPAPHPEPARPRRVEAVIAQWRQATTAERIKADERVAPVDTEREEPVETWRDVAPEVEREAPAEREETSPDEPVSEPNVRLMEAASGSHRRLLAALLFSAFFLGAAGLLFTFLRTGIEERKSISPVVSGKEIQGTGPSPVESDVHARSVQTAEPRVAPRPAGAAAGRTTRPGHLTVTEFGVGRRIVERALEGRSERFAEGDVVWFSTRVLGAEVGEPIHHVWLHEGRVLQSIQLELRGPDWRTHSRKTLRAAGQWAVEARDEGGGVLARATFTCEPARP